MNKYGTLFTIMLAFSVNVLHGMQKNNKKTELDTAISNNDLKEIKRLIKNDTDINERNSRGYTPLCLAVDSDKYDVVALLLERGAAVDGTNSFYLPLIEHALATPMVLAYQNSNNDIINLLLTYNASRSKAFARIVAPKIIFALICSAFFCILATSSGYNLV